MTTDQVRVGRDGTCEVAPVGTALPVDANDALNIAFKDLGEIHEDGLEHGFEAKYDSVKNWSGQVLRSFNSSIEVSFKLTFLETSAAVLELYYGQDVDVQSPGLSRIKLSAPLPDARSMVITVIDKDPEGTEITKRYVLANVQVTDRGKIKEDSSDATGYEMTFTANYDASVDGFGYLQIEEGS